MVLVLAMAPAGYDKAGVVLDLTPESGRVDGTGPQGNVYQVRSSSRVDGENGVVSHKCPAT